MTISSQSDFFLNTHKLSELKLDARQDAAGASEAVAQQFEALFIQKMLTTMRSATVVDESNHSDYLDFYQDMQDKQLALTMAKQGGIGISKFIMQQLPGGQDDSGKGGDALPTHQWQEVTRIPKVAKLNYQPENPAVVVNPLHIDDMTSKLTEVEQSNLDNWQTPKAFVSDVWPQALQAAKALGVSPEVLVAQSALETGWGKHVMSRVDGDSAFNMFGIKADARWQGATVTKPTLEFRDGVMRTEIAHFRAYESVSESLDDYVNFIQSNSRYQDALKHNGDDSHYLEGIHKAGYATDPNYADKIKSIMQSDRFQQGLASLSSSPTTGLNGGHNHV